MGALAMDQMVQRDRALDKANAARSTVKGLKWRMHDGEFADSCLLAAQILKQEWEMVGFMKVHEFLETIPKLGPVKVRRLLTEGDRRIWPLRRVDGLSERERLMLAARLMRAAK